MGRHPHIDTERTPQGLYTPRCAVRGLVIESRGDRTEGPSGRRPKEKGDEEGREFRKETTG